MSKKDKKQLLVIWGLAIVCWTIAIVAFNIYMNTPVVSAANGDGCPDGSYNIGVEKIEGEIICKLEPTGCPYGDSIPLDSPKCAPPADPENAYAPWTGKDTTPPDANRDYYDAQGNRYTYDGQKVDSAPKTPAASSETPNTSDFGGAGASSVVEPEQARIDSEQGPQSASINKNDKPTEPSTAQVAGGSAIILSILGGIGALVRKRFIG